jgi:hypothetical protein
MGRRACMIRIIIITRLSHCCTVSIFVFSSYLDTKLISTFLTTTHVSHANAISRRRFSRSLYRDTTTREGRVVNYRVR